MKKMAVYQTIKGNFEVYGEIGEDLFSPEILEIKKDGVVETDFGSTWAGRNRDEYDEWGAVLSAYVSDNNAAEFNFVCDEMIEFKKCNQSYTRSHNGKLVPNIVLSPNGDKATLVAISEDSRYYTNEEMEKYFVTDHNGKTVTDYECFFTSAMVQDWEQDKFEFIKPELKEWLAENY